MRMRNKGGVRSFLGETASWVGTSPFRASNATNSALFLFPKLSGPFLQPATYAILLRATLSSWCRTPYSFLDCSTVSAASEHDK